MKRNLLCVMLLLILTSLSISPVIAETGPAPYPPPFLSGNRINLNLGGQSVPSNQPSYIMHGYGVADWKERSVEDKRLYLQDKSFALFIGDEPIDLKRWKCWYQTYDESPQGPFEDMMLIVFYVQFEANYFLPGSVTLTGVWSAAGIPEKVITATITIT